MLKSLKRAARAFLGRSRQRKMNTSLTIRRLRGPALGVEQLDSRDLPSQATLAVASGIVNSTENRTDFIAGEYRQFLRRAADPAGTSFWLSQMQAGMSPEAVEANFVSSGEYLAARGSDPAQWLAGLYSDLLGRAPDAAG